MNAVTKPDNEGNARNPVQKLAAKKENAVPEVDKESNILPFVIAGILVAVTIIMWPKIKAWYLARKLRAEAAQGEVTNV